MKKSTRPQCFADRPTERRRYWDLPTGTRERRLLRAKREAVDRARKRCATQLTLDHV